MNLVILLFLFLVQFCNATETEKEKTLFKIGFEFQESHHLCPWAVDEASVQNCSIFSVAKAGIHLWDLTIDWQDLEFVTPPFSNLEEENFNSAIETIQISCEALSELNQKLRGITGGITFNKWRLKIQEKLNSVYPGQYLVSDIYEEKGGSLGSLILPHSFDNDFKARFQPQVTIQHKLSQSIPLILGLCSSSLTTDGNSFCLSLNEEGSIFAVKDIKTIINKVVKKCFARAINECQQFIFSKETMPQEGFLFLHMLTCLSLVEGINLSHTEEKRIEEVFEWYKISGQVNAKALLGVLSRRPFSNMWKDISHEVPYSTLMTSRVSSEFIQYLSQSFQCINYGELYFNLDGTRLDLKQYFSFHDDHEISQTLLKEGVLCTSFLRKNAEYQAFFQSYFEKIVESIEEGESDYYDFDVTTSTIRQQKSPYDLLSPPYFSSTDSSMGAYKSDAHDSSFGEVILEFRMISNIGEFARNKIDEIISEEGYSTNIASGEFLSRITQKRVNTLQNQAKGLFLFVKTLLDLDVENEI